MKTFVLEYIACRGDVEAARMRVAQVRSTAHDLSRAPAGSIPPKQEPQSSAVERNGSALTTQGSPSTPIPDGTATEDPLKRHVVELWCDTVGGRVWIVADEEDARRAMKRMSVDRAEIWTVQEIELIARINDPALRLQVAQFKRQLGGSFKPE
jgi:hypothetical protein